MTRKMLTLGPGLLLSLLVAPPLAAGTAAGPAPRDMTIVAGQWSWGSGSDRVADWESHAFYGTKGVAAPENVPGTRYDSVSWTDANGNLWLFGGSAPPKNFQDVGLNDLWKWDGTNWTWVSGSDEENQSGIYGTKGVAAPLNVPGARDQAVSWVDANGNFWLFGGHGWAAGNDGDLNDLWKWDGTSWTWVSGSNSLGQLGTYGTKGVAAAGNVPGARHGSVSWKDASGNFWLFGGNGSSASGTGTLNDLWKWDGASWTWVSGSDWPGQAGTYGTKGVAAAGNVPGARDDSVSWADSSGNLWLFGGDGYAATTWGKLNDLWKWNGTSWTWMSGSNGAEQVGTYGTKGAAAPENVPGARYSSVSWMDATGNLWLFGGYGRDGVISAGYLSDLWRWDGTNWAWMGGPNVANQPGAFGTKGVPAVGNVPAARYGAISWTDASGRHWLFGGRGYADTDFGAFNDLWRWDGTNWTWLSGSNRESGHGVYGTKGVAAPGNLPGARYASVSWRDASGNLWLFGGFGYAAAGGQGFLNDLWKWDGTNWTWVSGSNVPNQYGTYGTKGIPAPGNVPGARGAPVAWNDANGNLWLFGGKGCAWAHFGYLNDLWKWDGTSWTWVNGSSDEDPFGAYGTKGVAAPGNVPGGRYSAVSSSDASGSAWVFGGHGRASTTQGYLNDLWKWDGTSWTWVSGSDESNALGVYGTKGLPEPANVPGARENSISWSEPAGFLWLFGGRADAASSGRYLNDLWRWDGTNWTWVSGSDGFDQLGTYGTRGVANQANVPGARERSIAWTDAGGGLWLFGGWGLAATLGDWGGDLNDLWRWDGMSWTWMSGSNAVDQAGAYGTRGVAEPANVPGAREFSISWTDAVGNLWLFGGWGIDSGGRSGYLNDLWVFGTPCTFAPPTAGNGGPYVTGATIHLSAATIAGASYSWTGPDNFHSTEQNPTIPYATLYMAGTYVVTATLGACIPASSATNVVVVLGENLFVVRDGSGTGRISSSPSGIDCGGTCMATFPIGSQVTLTATPDGSSRFAGWVGGGCGGTGSCTVTMDVGKVVYATFLPPCGILPPPMAGNGGPFAIGGTIRLTASTSRSTAYLWTGPNGFTSTEQNPTIPNATTEMAGTYSVTAVVDGCPTAAGTTIVDVVPGQALSIWINGAGIGVVSSNPIGINCGITCNSSFPNGWQVTLTATPDGGSRFAGWIGEGCVGTDPCTVTMDGAKSVTATFLPSGGTGFHTLSPCRIVDTRDATGPFGGPALSAGAARAFAIAGQCSVPADASAVALNVTVTNPTSAGSLTVYPGTGAVPTTSTVSFAVGRTRANNATIGLIDGFVSILDRQETGTTDVIIDVSGYYR